MLTPQFEITQTDDDITISIHAPFANIQDLQIDADRDDFRFYAVPYYLRLKLPGAIEESPTSSGSYDCEKGDFILKFSKVNKGEVFPNLDEKATLLLPPKSKFSINPKIEVIGNPGSSFNQLDKSLDKDNKKEDNKDDDNKEDNNQDNNIEADNIEADNSEEDNKIKDDKEASNKWFIHQTLDNPSINLPINTSKYGFANEYSKIFIRFDPFWIKEILDLPMPDQVPEDQRKQLRERTEKKDFEDEHYMADYVEPEYAEPCILYTPKIYHLKKEDIKLNQTEIDILKDFPNKEYLLSDKLTKLVLFGLVDILYASCYNRRVTFGENTVESEWTINKLSSTLCWLQTFENMEQVIKACIRRSLCYPQVRNWRLSVEVFEDVKQVIKLGKTYIIKQFCEIYDMFNNSSEPRCLLNRIYIIDYLLWLQSIPESLIESLIPLLNDVYPCKEYVNLELIELEAAIDCTIKENIVLKNIVQTITQNTKNLHLNDPPKKNQESPPSDDSSTTSDSSSDIDTDSESDSSSDSSSSSSSSVDSNEIEMKNATFSKLVSLFTSLFTNRSGSHIKTFIRKIRNTRNIRI